MRDVGRKWALWSDKERYFETTITGWTDVIRGGICTSASTGGSGAGKTKKRSGASGGSGARKKGRRGSWGKWSSRGSWGKWSWDSWDGKSTRGAGKQKYARQGGKEYAWSRSWGRGWYGVHENDERRKQFKL